MKDAKREELLKFIIEYMVHHGSTIKQIAAELEITQKEVKALLKDET